MTPFFACGLEDAAITTHFDISAGSPVLDTTWARRTGAKAARINITSGVQAHIGRTLGASYPQLAITAAFELSALPSSQISIFRLGGTFNYDAWLSIEADGTMSYYAGSGSGQQTVATVSLNARHVLSWWIDGTSRIAGWSLDGVAQTAPPVRPNDEVFRFLYFGNTQSASAGAFTMYVDDVLVTIDSSDFPFESGYIDTSDVWQNYPPVWTTPADTASMTATPDLQFTSPASFRDQHFALDLDTVNTFNSGSLRSVRTDTSQTDWTYWNGSAWTAFPSTGLPVAFAGNEVRYAVTSALSAATWYRRVRNIVLV